MSAPAINPAPSPTPGAANPASAASGAHGLHGAQAQGPLGVFEAILATLAAGAEGGQTATHGAAVATAASGKPSVGKPATDKTAAGDGKGKDKAAGDGQSATDASQAAAKTDPSLALSGLVAASLPAVATPQAQDAVQGGTKAEGEPGQAAGDAPGLAVAVVKTADTPAAQALARLTGAAADADAAKTSPPAPSAADSALNANATAKLAVAATTKADLPAQPVQPAATTPVAPPAASPAPPAPAADATAAAVTPPPAAAPADQSAEPVAPVALKARVQATKTATRIDATKAAPAPGATAALDAKAADALQPASGGGAPKDGRADPGPAPDSELDAKAEPAEPGQTQAQAQGPADPATAAAATAPAALHAPAAAVRGAPQTVANLAAQIVKKLDGRSSQFDVQLDPAGLGKVNVHIDIASDGRMTAAMSFDTPQAAAELKARAGELHQAMQQAGFDLSGGMSFDVASDRGQGGGAQNQQADNGAAFRGRAFQAALDTTADSAPPQQLVLRRTALAGVDIRI